MRGWGQEEKGLGRLGLPETDRVNSFGVSFKGGGEEEDLA